MPEVSSRRCASCWIARSLRGCWCRRTRCLRTALFSYLEQRGADLLIAVKHSRHKSFQVIKDRLTYGRKAPLQASKRERKHGRDITWTLRTMPAPDWVVENWPGSATVIAVRGKGSRDGKPSDETRYHVTSLRTGAQALLRHVRDRWSIENSWHWPRDTQLKEDAQRYRETQGCFKVGG